VRAVLTVVPKLSDRIINGELLRHLAKTANDEQPGIRTNTTICLGKIARNLGVSVSQPPSHLKKSNHLTSPQSRAKVLAAAFARSLRDPFVHARNAALLALSATADLFSEEDCATKLLPIMCPSLVDKEKLIRDQAQKTVDIYIARIRKYAASMPDTALPPAGLAPGAGSGGTPRIGTPSANEAGWAGWAISSFTNKLASTSGTISSANANGGADTTTRSSSVPPTTSSTHKPPVPLASKPGIPLHTTRSSATVPTIRSPDPAAAFNDADEDFDGDWGGFDDKDRASTSKAATGGFGGFGGEDEGREEDDDDDDDPWGTPAVSKPSTTSFHSPDKDDGEPDFAGWLAAQNQSKSNKAKMGAKALPKGLVKATAKKSVVGGGGGGGAGAGAKAGTGVAAARKVVQPPKKEVVKEKKKEKDGEDEVEGWGDDW